MTRANAGWHRHIVSAFAACIVVDGTQAGHGMTKREIGALARPGRRATICSLLVAASLTGCDATSQSRPESDAASDAGDSDAADGDAGRGRPAWGGKKDAGSMSEPEDCNVERPTSCTDPDLRYADVEPIFAMRCTNTCHAAGNPDGNWPLTSYQHVADWAPDIRDRLATCMMPPPVAMVPMTIAEREKILIWLRCGYPH